MIARIWQSYRWRPGFMALLLALITILLIALFPLRLALGLVGIDGRVLSARLVEGSVWSGSIQDLRIGPAPVGDVYARLKFWPLLTGEARFAVDRPAFPGFPPIAVEIARGWSGFSVSGLSADLPASQLIGLPLGIIRAENLSFRFRNGGCQEASGQLRLDAAAILPGVELNNGFTGQARCEGGKLLIGFDSQTGLEKLDIAVDAKGRYVAKLSVAVTQGDTMTWLQRGFRQRDDRWVMQSKGQF